MGNMSKRNVRQQLAPLQPDESYWQKFILHRFGSLENLENKRSIVSKAENEGGKLDRDMEIFAYRLAERLTPLDGLDFEARQRALKVREQYRRQLERVLMGYESFEDWFSRTRTERGLHFVDFAQMIYESLQGLTSREARALREQYAEFLLKLKSAYSV